MRYRILLFVLAFMGMNALNAQVFYPVVARITQSAPYPVYLVDYSNPSQTSLSIQIQQNDASMASRNIRLRLFIEGQGYLIESTDAVQGEPLLVLTYGQVYNLSPAEVANYFKKYNLKVNPDLYNKPLPEGSVRLGVQVIDHQTGRALSGVQWGAPVWITVNEPPVWVMPEKESKITATLSPNIVFQWAPRHTNVSDVEYEFTLKELMYSSYAMGSIQNIFLSQPTFYTTKTSATSLVYNATMPPLVEGRVYAYRVRAVTKKGLEEVGLFRNFGYSEVQALFYGDPMRPMKAPLITLLKRDELSNVTVLQWNGEPEHTGFTIAFREKDKSDPWTAEKRNPTPNSTYHSFTFNDLDPGKSYEIRVGAEDKYLQSAYSASVFLDSLTVEQKRDMELSGKVSWAFTNDNFTDKSPLFTAAGNAGRTVSASASGNTLTDTRYPLEKARVSLISSESDDLSAGNLNDRKYTLLQKMETDAEGKFSLQTTNFELLKGLKYLYLVAEYSNGLFEKSVRKIGLYGKTAANIDLGEIVLQANTVRYSPKLLTAAAYTAPLEEAGLYRLREVITQNPYLAFEGNTGTEWTHNGQVYTKVADFLSNSTAINLAGNNYFNDQYIFRIREQGKSDVVFPVEKIRNTFNAQKIQVTDRFVYSPSPFRLKGRITRGGAGLDKAWVQAFGTSVVTDENGNYTLDIPLETSVNTNIAIKVIDPLNANNFKKETFLFSGSDFTADFDFEIQGIYLEAQVLDSDNKPAAGAIVLIGGQMLRTDGAGWFGFSGLKSQLSEPVKIRLDGYDETDIPLSAFASSVLPPGSEASAWQSAIRHTGISDPETYYLQNFTELGRVCGTYYSGGRIALQRSYHYRIIMFKEKTFTGLNIVNVSDSAEYVSGTLKINDEFINVPRGRAFLKGTALNGSGGYAGKTTARAIKVNTFRTPGGPTLVEEEFILSIPETAGIRDTTTFLIQVKEGVLFKGQVIDSTIYIEGLHVPGTVKKAGEKLNPVAQATIQISDINIPVIADGSGKFEVVVPVNRDLVFSLTKPGFTKTTTVIKKEQSNDFKTNARNFYMMQIDTNTVPNFKKLMGFDVEIERIVIHSSEIPNDADVETILEKGNRTYKITGRIRLDGAGTSELENCFSYSTYKTLSFSNILVRVVKDKTGTDNAVLVYKSANLSHTQYPANLFGYAPVMFKADPLSDPFIRLEHVKGNSGFGKIMASGFQFIQSNMAGLQFGTMQLADLEEEGYSFGKFLSDQEEEEEKPLKPAKNVTAFSSLSLEELSNSREFRIIFGSKVSNSALAKEGIDSTQGTYYKAEFAATNIPGIYSAMNMYIHRESATLNKDGISLEGYFSLPKFWKFKNSGALTINSLQINRKFNLESLDIAKNPNSKKGEITKLAIGNKWILYVNSFLVTNNFKGFGFSGTIHADKDNYLVINSLSVAKVDDRFYPSVSVSTPKQGLVFKNIKFTTLSGKSISFISNAEEESYEVSAAFKLEYVSTGKGNAALAPLAKKIFPLTLQSFVWSTTGKLLVAVQLGNPIKLGPVQVKVRRLIYTKGGAVTQGEINQLLALTQEEGDKLSSTKAFDKANTFSKAEREKRDAIITDALFVSQMADEVASEDPAASWAFAFAGGIEVTKVKGMEFDSDLSFVVGDFGNGVEFQLNEIAMKLSSTGFKALGKLKIETSDERIGFEGAVEIETVKQKLAGSFKFYQLYDASSGNEKGIELGASLLAKTNIVMGSLTWTSLGGGFDINTATGKYKFLFGISRQYRGLQ